MKLRARGCGRTALGSGMVEGVVSLGLVTSVICAGVLFLINSGMATYYKLKIGYVASETAKFANTLEKHERSSKAKSYAESLLKKLAVHHNGAQIDFKDIKIDGIEATVCTIACKNLSLAGSLLGPIDIRDVGVAPSNKLLVNKTVTIDVNNNHFHLPLIDKDDDRNNMGKLGTKSYLAVSTVNHADQPRHLTWVLPADYDEDGYHELPSSERIFRPAERPDLQQTYLHRNDFPSHGFNGVYYIELESGAVIDKN